MAATSANFRRFSACVCLLAVVVWMAPVGAQLSPTDLAYTRAADYSADKNGVSMLVSRNGRVIFERYDNGGAADRAWITASGTKSFWGSLLAAMVQDGEAEVDERVSETITEWRGDPRKETITVAHLLSMTDGLDGQDSGPGPVETYAEAVALPALHEPGTFFDYRPAPWQIFGEWVRRKMSPRYANAVDYIQARLFDALNIAPASWPVEADGYPRMPSSSVWTARDWAIYGEFVRRGGSWNGEQIVDPDTLAISLRGVTANPGYGLGWWLAADVPAGIIRQRGRRDFLAYLDAHPSLPDNIFIAFGGGNQRMYIVPSWELVIVRQEKISASPGPPSDFSDLVFWQRLLGEP